MFITADTNHIVLPWRQDLAAVVPHARSVDYQGERMLVMPNRKEEAKLARNLGLAVPAPILTRFNWCGLKPWNVQRSTAALLTESQRCYVLSELGTGKTLASIFAAEYLRQTGEVKRVLITAPLSVLTPVWEKELFLANPQAQVRVLHSDKRVRRLQLLAEDATYYIVNHHGLSLLQDELIAKKFDLFIIDELATFRTMKTDLWRAARNISNGIKYVWGMTGSPRPKAPTDAWAQARLLTPERTTRTFTRFRDLTMMQVSQFKWAERAGANDIVYDAMQPAVRYTLSDVAELPSTVTIDHTVPLEPQAQQAYKLMFDKMRLMSERGEITAANEGVLQSKLLQVACGFMYTDDKSVYTLPNKPRLEALRDFCRASAAKVIVFVPFVHALQAIKDYLVKEGESCELVYGGTAKGARDRIFAEFQHNPLTPRVLVAHPQCMAHGLNLTSASTIVWYTATNNPEHYEQANGRIRRPGQKEKQLIVHLTGTPVERVAYGRLKARGRMQGMLLELFHQQELEV